jgi:hypothetical protein
MRFNPTASIAGLKRMAMKAYVKGQLPGKGDKRDA